MSIAAKSLTQAPLRTFTTSYLTSAPTRRQVVSCKSPLRPFSTNPPRLQQGHPKDAKQSPKGHDGQPEIPQFSLDGLGISPNMKKFIIGVVCVFGTMETYTYYIWIKNRWFPDEKKGEEAPENSASPN